MGELKNWKCINCNYTTDISGGKDRGFESFTQTFQCTTCKILIDIAVDETEWCTEQWKPHYCKKCNSLLNVWDTNAQTCPCCGSKMKSSKFPIIFWD
jgi:hypothetical protein